MSQRDDFDFWVGEYLQNPGGSESETARLLQALCTEGNRFALEYVQQEDARKAREAIADLPLNTVGEDEAEEVAPLFSVAETVYPDDWTQIATDLKTERHWTCEVCTYHNYQSALIQVHHVDGDKADSNRSNLQVLCAKCHGMKHGHDPIWPTGVTEAERRSLMLHHIRRGLKAK